MIEEFIKAHGLGNDFIIFDKRDGSSIEHLIDNASFLCDRYFGIGADQLIIIQPSAIADVRMLVLNPDGSFGGACGNATRCLVEIIGKNSITIEVGARTLTCNTVADLIYVNMGAVSYEGVSIIDGVEFYLANIGNPHAITFMDCDRSTYGPKLQEVFSNGINVNFATIKNNTISLEVFERGVNDFTLACASGASATFGVAVYLGLIDNEAIISLPGGNLKMLYDNGSIIQAGPAKLVYSGKIIL